MPKINSFPRLASAGALLLVAGLLYLFYLLGERPYGSLFLAPLYLSGCIILILLGGWCVHHWRARHKVRAFIHAILLAGLVVFGAILQLDHQ